MKIAILTHRLGENYGGIVQALALQCIVRMYIGNKSCDVQTTNLHPLRTPFMRVRATLAGSYRNKTLYINAAAIDASIYSQTRSFVARNIKVGSAHILDNSDLVIVGSDQVWRAKYVDPVKYMLGDAVDDRVPRISYAASFGTDDLGEYTSEQVARMKGLARKFTAISVREETGIDICKTYFGVDAICHVDPTLLLDANYYSALIDKAATKTKTPEGSLFVYLLDRGEVNDSIIDKAQQLLGVSKFEIMPKTYKSLINFLLHRKDYTMYGVEQWLRSFRDAEYIITDSFHGTVFSIIFNRPFITIGNKGRGLTRFMSLLSLVGLEDRLVSSLSDVTDQLITRPIDWESVNRKIKKEQKRSREYLVKYLG